MIRKMTKNLLRQMIKKKIKKPSRNKILKKM